MGYNRVFPRDLFNEAKLLKCLGQLCLLIHEGKCSLKFAHDTKFWEGFNVQQDPSDGGLFVANLRFYTKRGDWEVCVASVLNSPHPYPLVFTSSGEEHPMFIDNGQLSQEYFEYLHSA